MSGRTSGFGCMALALTVCAACVLLCINAAPALVCNQRLSLDEVGLCNPNGTVDKWHCQRCPPGYGLSVECGKMHPAGTAVGCVLCKRNSTYSNTYDISQCKKCTKCQKNGVIKSGQCKQDEDTIQCSCKVGYYRDSHSKGCLPCSWCCSDKSNETVKECNNPEVPLGKRCSFQTKELCAPTTHVSVPSSITTASATEQSSSTSLTPTKESAATSTTEKPSSTSLTPTKESAATSTTEKPSSTSLTPTKESAATSTTEQSSSTSLTPTKESAATSTTEKPSSLHLTTTKKTLTSSKSKPVTDSSVDISVAAITLSSLIFLSIVLVCCYLLKRKGSSNWMPRQNRNRASVPQPLYIFNPGRRLLQSGSGNEFNSSEPGEHVRLYADEATARYHVACEQEPSRVPGLLTDGMVPLPATRLDGKKLQFICDKLGPNISELKCDVRHTLCTMLNVSVNGKDYNNLDQFCNLNYYEQRSLQQSQNPMEGIIQVMITRLVTLKSFLEELYRISRGDVVHKLYMIAVENANRDPLQS